MSVVLRIGHRVPEFALPDSENRERKLSEFTKNGSVVLAFFPFAFSGVCDREMCAFRDDMVGLQGLQTAMVGISVDSVFTLKVFRETYNLGFPLLSDFNKKVIRLFGVLQDPWVGFGYRGVAKRSVFVVDRRSILRYKWVTDVPSQEPPYDQVTDVLRKVD